MMETVSPAIKPINKSAVHKICAGQVILDLSSAVKELVENSLDAGATSIEIALKDYGQEWFQVIDNGCGISPSNFKVLALKHHTSKLGDFPDLQSLTTFGFRGEALSSLCALGNLIVETRTKNESVATHLTYDHSGLLTEEKKTARQVGTTVIVKKLFSNLPVRSREFSRNIRKEYGKLISLLNAYALISKGVRIVCTNTTGRNLKSVVLKTQGTDSLKDNIITVFGMSLFNCLEPVTVSVSDNCMVNGFISKSGQGNGRYLGDRQFFFVNGRPVDMPKVSKLINELYKGANSKQYPIAIMNFTVPTKACDVNVTPDKRKIFFSDESSILQSLREGLQLIYSSTNVSFSINKVDHLTTDDSNNVGDSNNAIDISEDFSPHENFDLSEEKTASDDSCAQEILTSKHILADDVSAQKVKTKAKTWLEIESFSFRKDEKQVESDCILGAQNATKAKNPYTHKSTGQLNHATIEQNSPTILSSAENSVARLESNSHSVVQSSLNKFITISKRKHENVCAALSEIPVLRNHTVHCQSMKSNSERHHVVKEIPLDRKQADAEVELIESPPSKHRKEEIFSEKCIPLDSNSDGGNQEGRASPLKEEIPTCNINKGTVEEDALGSKNIEEMEEDDLVVDPLLQSPKPATDVSNAYSNQKVCSTLHFSFQDLQARRKTRSSRLQTADYACPKSKLKRCYAAATLEISQSDNDERKARALAAATTELERLFKKEDFSQMKVIGQFNRGFIIGKLDQDLFIVDQHAADEKFNFERLSQSTILNQQPFLRPIQMELSPEEEVVVSMNMDIIRKNGFSLEENVHAPPGLRFRLTAVPFSKNITFGLEDVKDLISILTDGHGDCSITGSYRLDTASSVCPPRVRAMLASRACRSSIVIGDALGRNEMQKILEHLAELKSPWNCPHGRPTMRHLVDLMAIHQRSNENASVL